jgi:hypothetical protein
MLLGVIKGMRSLTLCGTIGVTPIFSILFWLFVPVFCVTCAMMAWWCTSSSVLWILSSYGHVQWHFHIVINNYIETMGLCHDDLFLFIVNWDYGLVQWWYFFIVNWGYGLVRWWFDYLVLRQWNWAMMFSPFCSLFEAIDLWFD